MGPRDPGARHSLTLRTILRRSSRQPETTNSTRPTAASGTLLVSGWTVPRDSPVRVIGSDGDPDVLVVGGIATSGVGATLVDMLGSDVAESDEPGPSDGGIPDSEPPGARLGIG